MINLRETLDSIDIINGYGVYGSDEEYYPEVDFWVLTVGFLFDMICFH